MPKKKTRKKTYQRKNTQPSSTPIIWLLGGIIIGLIIPSIFFLKYYSASPTSTKQVIKVETNEIGDKTAVKHKQFVTKNQSTSKIKSTKEMSPTQKSQYEFYNLLSSQGDNSRPYQESDAPSANSKYSLEIAKFTDFNSADQLKAQLILMGIDNVTVFKNARLYKVIVGPYNAKMTALDTQKQLKQNAIKSILIIH